MSEITVTQKATHTPGPWGIHPYTHQCDVGANDQRPGFTFFDVYVGTPNGTIVGCAQGHTLDVKYAGYPAVCAREEVEANARLFAAAPYLLEALQTTALNIRSLGPAGVLPQYEMWLRVVEDGLCPERAV